MSYKLKRLGSQLKMNKGASLLRQAVVMDALREDFILLILHLQQRCDHTRNIKCI